MIPGTTTKISEGVVTAAATILPKSDLVIVSGTTSIATIRPPYAGFSGILALVPADGGIDLFTTGNIAVAVTCAQNRVTFLVYSKANDEWYPGAIS